MWNLWNWSCFLFSHPFSHVCYLFCLCKYNFSHPHEYCVKSGWIQNVKVVADKSYFNAPGVDVINLICKCVNSNGKKRGRVIVTISASYSRCLQFKTRSRNGVDKKASPKCKVLYQRIWAGMFSSCLRSNLIFFTGKHNSKIDLQDWFWNSAYLPWNIFHIVPFTVHILNVD